MLLYRSMPQPLRLVEQMGAIARLAHLSDKTEKSDRVQELLGRKDVKTTMIYTHVINRGGRGVSIPLDL